MSEACWNSAADPSRAILVEPVRAYHGGQSGVTEHDERLVEGRHSFAAPAPEDDPGTRS